MTDEEEMRRFGKEESGKSLRMGIKVSNWHAFPKSKPDEMKEIVSSYQFSADWLSTERNFAFKVASEQVQRDTVQAAWCFSPL